MSRESCIFCRSTRRIIPHRRHRKPGADVFPGAAKACRGESSGLPGKGKGEDRVVEGVPVHYASSLGTYFSCPLSFSFLRKFREMAKWADVVEFHVPFPLADLACLLSGYRGGVVIAWHSDVVRQKTLLRFL